MRKFHLITGNLQEAFLPLTYLTSFKDLLFGTQTIGQRWQAFALKHDLELVFQTGDNEALPCHPLAQLPHKTSPDFADSQSFGTADTFFNLDSPWSLLRYNATAIIADEPLFHGVTGFTVNPDHLRKTGKHNLIVHESALVEDCHFNTSDGPVIISENVHLMCGSAFRGPLFIGKESVVKMGTAIYGGTSVGPCCTIGGEVKNSIFQGYANKGHHGYIGDSFIGAWCNLGAGTSCSNVKNTAGSIKYWHIAENEFKNAGQKAGVLLGDHVKTAINTSLNSGTVIGIFANVFDCQTLSPKYIPAFTWGGHQHVVFEANQFRNFIERWQHMKGYQSSEFELNTIAQLYNKINQ